MLVWIIQTGEPLHCDLGSPRAMRAMNLADTLVERGHEVVIWSSGFYHQEKRHRTKIFKEINVNNKLMIFLIPSPGYKKNISFERIFDHIILSLNFKKLLSQYKGPMPDIAFIGFPPIEIAAVSINWLTKNRVPSIVDVKDLWPSIFLEPIPDLIKPIIKTILWPYFYITKKMLKKATAFSSMSVEYLNWIEKFSGRKLKSNDTVNPLTSKISKLSHEEYENARKWWANYSIDDTNKNRFCFIGSFMTVFDFSSVKTAAKIFHDKGINCTFVICGDGGSFQEIKNNFKDLPNVIFPGWIDRPKIQFLSMCCSGTIIPYKNIENYILNTPNKVIDALALGLPILTTLSGVVGDMVKEEKVGFSCNTDTKLNMHEAMNTLLENPDLVAEMSIRGKLLYEKKFSYKKVYDDLASNLETISKISFTNNNKDIDSH